MRDEPFQGKWKESWKLYEVDNSEWGRLRKDLRTEFESLRQAIESQTELAEQDLTWVLALLPHAAYHLGTIRQMISRVRH